MSLFERINARADAAKAAHRAQATGWWRVPEKWEGAWIAGRPVEWEAVRNVRAQSRLKPNPVSAYQVKRIFKRPTHAERTHALRRIIYANSSFDDAALWYAVLPILMPRPLPKIQWLESSGRAGRPVTPTRLTLPPLVANCIVWNGAPERVERREYVFGLPVVYDASEHATDGYIFDLDSICSDVQGTMDANWAALCDERLAEIRTVSELYEAMVSRNVEVIERRRALALVPKPPNDQRRSRPRGKLYTPALSRLP